MTDSARQTRQRECANIRWTASRLVGKMSCMAPRKSPDLTIRLTRAERARLDRAAGRLHERGVSTWARRALLEAAERPPPGRGLEALEEIWAYADAHQEEMKARWEEIDRVHREGWNRGPR